MLVLVTSNQGQDLSGTFHHFQFAKGKGTSEGNIETNTFEDVNVHNCTEQFAHQFLIDRCLVCIQE